MGPIRGGRTPRWETGQLKSNPPKDQEEEAAERVAHIECTPEEKARAQAQAALLSALLGRDPLVIAFRERYLSGHPAPKPSDAGYDDWRGPRLADRQRCPDSHVLEYPAARAFLDSHAVRYLPVEVFARLGIPFLPHQEDGEHIIDWATLLEDARRDAGPYRTMQIRFEWTWPTEHWQPTSVVAWHLSGQEPVYFRTTEQARKGVSFLHGSPLDDLRLVAEHIERAYGYGIEAEIAAGWVLTGQGLTHKPVDIIYPAKDSEPTGMQTVTMRVDRCVAPNRLKALYEQAGVYVSRPEEKRAHQRDQHTMEVVTWVYSQSLTEGELPAGGRLPTWHELLARWNATHSRKYKYPSDLHRPFKRGFTTLLGPNAMAHVADRGLWPAD